MVLHLQITVTVTVYEADERQSQISSITHDAARLLLPAVKLWKIPNIPTGNREDIISLLLFVYQHRH